MALNRYHQIQSNGDGNDDIYKEENKKMSRQNEEGLILPKKLINPCLESKDRQDLHRELLFNQKIGKNVLNQKSELQKVLQRQKERQFIAAHHFESQANSSPLQQELGKVITERAQKLENTSSKDVDNNSNHSSELEFLKIRAKLAKRNTNM
ncbi:hypothetical protein PVAND_011398 [Polypedilum vanderplanki]|uniref:Protein FAM107B n=1 Tax=Polypedilum vanderplanki TaxID=319348 RepID=A0A9J6CIG0_POLVA|nr:hypothetical protein PVAND_011398 [Polypedilum vanderplanki]